MHFNLKPYLRLSLGLIGLTLSIILAGHFFGIVPDPSKAELANRKNLTEALAVQFAFAAEKHDFVQIERTLKFLVNRNTDVLSGAMRASDGSYHAIAGDHHAIWPKLADDEFSTTYIQVPIMQGSHRWGTVELSFAPFLGKNLLEQMKSSFWGMLLFIAISGFLGYSILLKRALKELDPSNVIPPRVRTAFDTLTEGILILDEQGRIVLANRSFGDKVGFQFDQLLGKEIGYLNWEKASAEQLKENWQYPWDESLQNLRIQTRVRLSYRTAQDDDTIFMVNSAPILGNGNECKGALVTFDDVTEIEDNNIRLDTMLKKLEVSRSEIARQNLELKRLAEIDPLTGFYNRRALNLYFNELFNETQKTNRELICIMLDIDHFKSINDNYGHQTGDEVIKLVTAIAKENLRESDIVGRYGGEEFCLVLANIDCDKALKIAERIRVSIMNAQEYHAFGIKRVTISLGLSSIKDGVKSTSEMIELADQALYFAKKNGRNRAVFWHSLPSTNGVTHEVQENIATKTAKNWDSEVTSQDSKTIITDINQLHAKISELEKLNKEQKKLIEQNLNYDSVTRLPSRTLFHEHLKTAIAYAARSNQYVAIASIALTNYKRIHTSLGHETAEKLIIEISRRLSSVLRTTDTISADIDNEKFDSILSRKNDANFFALLPELKKDQSINWIINRIQSTFNQVIVLDGYNIQLESAIGISIYPIDAQSTEMLLDYADQALNHAELAGIGSCQFYSAEMNAQYITQMKIESGLVRAIAQNEFEIFYQPIINMQQGVISKLEALLRWNQSEKEILTAFSFIEVAERSGLIIKIGDWVCRKVISQLAIWQKEIASDIQISVNISSLQLQQPDLADKIYSYLQAHRVSPRNLIIEVTESMVIHSVEIAAQTLERFREMGIRIALDDFGMGYSSFQYLQKFPVDIIKIDRVFIHDIEENVCNNSIVSAIIAMSKKMRIGVVAEGVETEAQFKYLYRLKCEEVQGYLTGKPMSQAQIQQLLEKQKASLNNPPMAINQ